VRGDDEVDVAVLVRVADGERALQVRAAEVVVENRAHPSDEVDEESVQVGVDRRAGHRGASVGGAARDSGHAGKYVQGVWKVRLVIAGALLVSGSGCGGGAEDADAPPAGAANPPVLAAGEERNFAPGKLSAGDAITCVTDGLTIEVVVPKPRHRGLVSKSTNAWKKDGSRASVEATVWSNRRVVATCS
jgi:hypothetical protein